jgi:hypothetical protein
MLAGWVKDNPHSKGEFEWNIGIDGASMVHVLVQQTSKIPMVKVTEFLAASVGDVQSFFSTQLRGQM